MTPSSAVLDRVLLKVALGLAFLLSLLAMSGSFAAPVYNGATTQAVPGYVPGYAPVATPLGATASGAMADGAQDFELVRQVASSFLYQQAEGLPGKVTITLAPAAPRGLANCNAIEPFLPPGVRLWGRAMVGVRCNGERPWTIYLQAKISIEGDYFVATRSISAGETIQSQDMMSRHGDLTALPTTVITNPMLAIGSVAVNGVNAGFPLRSDLIRSPLAIRYGQGVRVVARGNGFAVSSEGSALANAEVGQPVKVRTASGVIVSGIAQPDMTVEVPL